MQVLSATEAISPAIDRTRQFLFHPFRWGTFLKLCVVAVLTEGSSSNFNFPNMHHATSDRALPISGSFSSFDPMNLTPEWIALIVVLAIVGIVVSICVFYLITRLRFALFHCLIHQIKEIRPGWQLYRAQAGRFFWLSLVVGFVFMAVALTATLPFLLGLFRQVRSAQPGNEFDFAGFFSLVLPLIPIVLFLILIAIGVDVILRDLMLPHMALENSSAAAAWSAARSHFAAEKGSFLLYALLRVILPLVAFLAAFIVLVIPLFLIFGVLGLSIRGLDDLISNSRGLDAFFLILFDAVLILVSIFGGVSIYLSVAGPINIAVRNYALFFYGGRYRTLGNVLFPPPPPAEISTRAPEII